MSLAETIGKLFRGPRSTHDPIRFQEDLLTSLLVMAWIVEARDPYTGGHMWRVSQFARELASTDDSLSDGDVARITIGGFLHDLGKVAIPDAILKKPGRVTDEEYAVIKTHPEVGMRLLAGHPLAELVRPSVLLHHETPDGTGYPFGMAGNDLPLDARIIGVCDAFDAMTSTRPYRKGMPIEKALDIIEEAMDRQFDRVYGSKLVELGRNGSLNHIVGHSDEGIPLHDCPMCGPTLVMKREQKVGDHLYCHNCTGEFVTMEQDGRLQTQFTGNKGSPKNLGPEADTDLVKRMVRQSARALLQPSYSAK